MTRLLQAAAMTSTVYLTMLISYSPVSKPPLYTQIQSPPQSEPIEHFLTEVIDFLLSPIGKNA